VTTTSGADTPRRYLPTEVEWPRVSVCARLLRSHVSGDRDEPSRTSLRHALPMPGHSRIAAAAVLVAAAIAGCTHAKPPRRADTGSQWSTSYTSDYSAPGSYDGNGSGHGHAGQLTAVVPFARDDVLAAGYTFRISQYPIDADPVVMKWGGSSWTTWEHQPDGGTNGYAITSMAATSEDDVWLEGSVANERAPIEQLRRWDGQGWSIVTTRGLPYDWSAEVILVGATPWLVGHDVEHGGALIASYEEPTSRHPARWVAAHYTRFGGFAAEVIRSRDDAWAVGSTAEDDAPISSPLIAHLSKGRWRIVHTPAVRGGLSGVAAASARDALAVGTETHIFNGRTKPVVLRYDGHRWRRFAAPPTAKALTSVVASPDGYWAAGTDARSPSRAVYFHLEADGSWTAVQAPGRADGSSPDFGHINDMTRVPGTTTEWAVGYHFVDGCMSDGCIDDSAGALTIDVSP
jgi:hypothetical protein